MIKLFMDLNGKVPHKIIRKSLFRDRHFDDKYNFLFYQVDSVTQKEKTTIVSKIEKVNDLFKMLCSISYENDDITIKKLHQLKDLLEKIFTFDHRKRISVQDCIAHPFIQEPF